MPHETGLKSVPVHRFSLEGVTAAGVQLLSRKNLVLGVRLAFWDEIARQSVRCITIHARKTHRSDSEAF